MALAEPFPLLTEIKRSIGKRRKIGIPINRLDLMILAFGKKIKLGKKAYPTDKESRLQILTRERFKEADCIYWRMTPWQKKIIKEWAQELDKKLRLGLKGYHYFMQRTLTNYMPDLLTEYFCVEMEDLKYYFTTDKVVIYTRLAYQSYESDPFAFFERIARRT